MDSRLWPTLRGLTLTQGNHDFRQGGAITNYGNLTLDGTTISNSGAKGGQGGAIYNNAGTVTVIGSTFSSNHADSNGPYQGQGGAIWNQNGTLTVVASTFSNNHADGGLGGAITNNFNGTLILSRSTLYGNHADGQTGPGGGITPGFGGAIYTSADSVSTTLTASTVAANHAGNQGTGGAIDNNGTLTLQDTIVAANAAPVGPEISGGFSGDHNVIGGVSVTPDTATNAGLSVDGTGAPILANNGGPTLTIALDPANPAPGANPAIDTGTCAVGDTIDQRGDPRPDSAGTACDIGAFESNAPVPPTATPTSTPVPPTAMATSTATPTPSDTATATALPTATAMDTAIPPMDTPTNTPQPATTPTTTTVGSSAKPAVVGQQVTYTATVTPAPDGGTVSFEDGSSTISGCGSQPVDTTTGTATCQVTYAAPGSHSITALYGGDSRFGGSQNATAYTQTVNKAATTTTLSSAPNPAVLGQAVTVTATIGVVAPGAGTPTGTVDFYDGAAKLGSGTLSTKADVTLATFATSALAVGSHALTATYNTDGNFSSSTSSAVTQLVRYAAKLLYKPPLSIKSGANAPIKLQLVDAAGHNLSSASLAVPALCVVPQGTATCAGAAITYTNQSFTYATSLPGYQFNVKTTGLAAGKTYQVLFWAAGEDPSTYHADANATFTITK